MNVLTLLVENKDQDSAMLHHITKRLGGNCHFLAGDDFFPGVCDSVIDKAAPLPIWQRCFLIIGPLPDSCSIHFSDLVFHGEAVVPHRNAGSD